MIVHVSPVSANSRYLHELYCTSILHKFNNHILPIDKIHLGEIYLQNAFFKKSSCNYMIENRNNIKNRVKTKL